MRVRHLFLSFTFAASLGAAAFAQQASAVDKLVLAVVNGEEITRARLVERLLDQRGDEALDKLINRELVVQAAERRKITVTPDEIEGKLSEVRERFQTEENYKAFLTRSRLTEDQLRSEIESTVLLQEVALAEQPILPDELIRYDVRVIVANDQPTAEKWIKELQDGGNFIKIASERSEEKSLRAAGGRMRAFLAIEMLDISAAIKEQQLKPGQFTKKPVNLGENRWAIVKLEELLPITSASALEQERMRAAMTAYRIDRWIAAAREKAEVQKKPLSAPVVAIVNGKQVPRTLLVSRLLASHGEETLEQMVNRAILLQAAKKVKAAVTDAESAEKLKELKARFKNPEAFQAFLTRGNLTERQLQEQLGFSELLERVAIAEQPITDDDLQRYDIRMILCPNHTVAQEWIQELEKGADFEKMATERSLDPQGRASGGRMTPFIRVEMLDVYRGIQEQKLKPGEITRSPVLLADNSNVIIKMEALLPVSKATKEEREKLEQIVTRYRVSRWLDDARKRSKINLPTPVSAVINVADAR